MASAPRHLQARTWIEFWLHGICQAVSFLLHLKQSSELNQSEKESYPLLLRDIVIYVKVFFFTKIQEENHSPCPNRVSYLLKPN